MLELLVLFPVNMKLFLNQLKNHYSLNTPALLKDTIKNHLGYM